jgi:3D (Asp-Asp-Asp) domain-containing protein
MTFRPIRTAALILTSILALSLGSCTGLSEGPQRPSEPPVVVPKTGRTMRVRTTAYHHTEPGGSRNAVGSRLRGQHSAAADWSWLPLGTTFRIRETGEDYIIEDYGSALVNRKTIDLYKTTRGEMNRWGVRHVNIDIIKLGSYRLSYNILKTRVHNRHCAIMVANLRTKLAQGAQ